MFLDMLLLPNKVLLTVTSQQSHSLSFLGRNIKTLFNVKYLCAPAFGTAPGNHIHSELGVVAI